MSSLAGKPLSYIIFPEEQKRAQIESVTSEASPYPGRTVPSSGNFGRMLPLQSGSLTSSAEEIRLQVKAAGAVGGSEYVWRRLNDAADTFRGGLDPRYWTGYHSPFTSSVGSDNCACVFHKASNRIIVYNCNDATDQVNIKYKAPSDRYDLWATTSYSLAGRSVSTGQHNMAALELPDGRIMLIVRTFDASGSPTQDFDVYHSDDGQADLGGPA